MSGDTNPFNHFSDIFKQEWSSPSKKVDWTKLEQSKGRLKRDNSNCVIFDVETAGLNKEPVVTYYHPPEKSYHNYGIAMDCAMEACHRDKDLNTPDYWRNAALYFARPTYDDRIISMMMLMEATKREMNNCIGISKERLGGEFTGIQKIQFPELLNELLNYKPKEMKRFKNRFAASGSIINLLKFEQELLKLGYTLIEGVTSVFDFRDTNGNPAKYITSGSHCASPKGTFRPAANDGAASVRFDLDTSFDSALKYASEVEPLAYTRDGVAIYDTKTKVHGVKLLDREDNANYYPSNRIYRGHVLLSTYFSQQLSPKYAWFSTPDKAKEHVDKTVPVLTTEDGVKKFIGDKVWHVRPDFTYHFFKSGLSATSGDNVKAGYRFFEKEENAVEYIKRNKPLFSQNQVEEFLQQILGPGGFIVQVESDYFPKDFVKKD
jgi:hypothetical protein